MLEVSAPRGVWGSGGVEFRDLGGADVDDDLAQSMWWHDVKLSGCCSTSTVLTPALDMGYPPEEIKPGIQTGHSNRAFTRGRTA
jgi:hypothetical protein